MPLIATLLPRAHVAFFRSGLYATSAVEQLVQTPAADATTLYGDTMFTVSDAARAELDAFFNGKDKSPIRIYLAPGGCSGPRAIMALDTPNADDTVFEEQGHTFCVHNEFLALAGGFSVSFAGGFVIETTVPLGGGGGGCGGCASSGGCAEPGSCCSSDGNSSGTRH